jgi:hypothetical protein
MRQNRLPKLPGVQKQIVLKVEGVKNLVSSMKGKIQTIVKVERGQKGLTLLNLSQENMNYLAVSCIAPMKMRKIL